LKSLCFVKQPEISAMLQSIWNYVLAELRAIASAPVAIALIVVLMALGTFLATRQSYSTRMEDLTWELKLSQRERNEYRAALQVLPDQAKARIGALEDQLSILRMRVDPRTLTVPQRQALIDHARLNDAAFLLTIEEEKCPDCSRYAADFEDVLHSISGWSVRRTVVDVGGERPRHGVGIRIHEPLRPPPAANVLREALQLSGLQVDMLSGAPDTEVHLVIASPESHGMN
jgi:hypothetical protein